MCMRACLPRVVQLFGVCARLYCSLRHGVVPAACELFGEADVQQLHELGVHVSFALLNLLGCCLTKGSPHVAMHLGQRRLDDETHLSLAALCPMTSSELGFDLASSRFAECCQSIAWHRACHSNL